MTVMNVRSRMCILIGLTALSVAACGSSTTASQPASTGSSSASSSAASSSPAPNGGRKDHVAGLISAVTGNTVTVTARDATKTVAFSASTKISEMTPAALTDVTSGSCVSVRPARGDTAAGAPMTAAAVVLSAPVNGQCFAGAKAPAGSRALRGTVASAGADTMAVASTAGGTPVTVALTADTTYAKRADSNSQAIAQGKCIAAQGTSDGGTLQADAISLRPTVNGSCPSGKH